MNEKMLFALRFGTPVWSNKLGDWCYVLGFKQGVYYLAQWPKVVGFGHNLSEIDLDEVFEVSK
jgi:hypothetical protein